MNFLAGILIVFACTYIGIGIDNYYKSKIKVIKEFYSFIDYTLAEISYLKTDIFALIKKYKNQNQSKLAAALSEINNPVEMKAEELKLSFLNTNEKQMIVAFLKDLLRLDTNSQKVFAEEYKLRIESYIKKLEEEESVKGKLYKKLAPLLGIGIMIVII